jgi:hypothetical protein
MIEARGNTACHLVRVTQVCSMKENAIGKGLFRRLTGTGKNLITRPAKSLHQAKSNALGPPGNPNGACTCHGGTMGDQA